jgi:hypothetical protein
MSPSQAKVPYAGEDRGRKETRKQESKKTRSKKHGGRVRVRIRVEVFTG